MNAVIRHEISGNPPSTNTVSEWLAALARLVSPSFPADAAEAFAAFKPLLAELPIAAFNRDTLDEAARSARSPNRVPTYAEVHAVLVAWIAERRPLERRETTPLPSLPPGERCTPDQAAASLAAHGWRRTDDRLVPPFATRDDAPPVKPRYLTGDALEGARASTPLVAAARDAQRRAREAHP